MEGHIRRGNPKIAEDTGSRSSFSVRAKIIVVFHFESQGLDERGLQASVSLSSHNPVFFFITKS